MTTIAIDIASASPESDGAVAATLQHMKNRFFSALQTADAATQHKKTNAPAWNAVAVECDSWLDWSKS